MLGFLCCLQAVRVSGATDRGVVIGVSSVSFAFSTSFASVLVGSLLLLLQGLFAWSLHGVDSLHGFDSLHGVV